MERADLAGETSGSEAAEAAGERKPVEETNPGTGSSTLLRMLGLLGGFGLSAGGPPVLHPASGEA